MALKTTSGEASMTIVFFIPIYCSPSPFVDIKYSDNARYLNI
jgi:hypothetical protein